MPKTREGFMKLAVYKKGALYSADCAKCCTTQYAHEWTHDDPNGARDAMKAGTLRCDECGHAVDSDTFTEHRRSYAGRYSAPGYMDCTPWDYDTNLRRLLKTLRDMYEGD